MAFNSGAGFSFDDGHLDMSYAKREGWGTSEHGGLTYTSPQSIFVGDPESGPMLIITRTAPGPSHRTYTHYHGTDQFRVILKGVEQSISRLTFRSGEFCYQEAGMLYKEGVGGPEEIWALLVAGDRRGLSPTAPFGDNSEPKLEMSDKMKEAIASSYAKFAEMAKTNPGGPAGIPSVATTLGPCRNGFLCGSFNKSDDWRAFGEGVTAAGGMWGDRTSGPIQLMIKADAGAIAAPRTTSAAETVLVIIDGSCRIGDKGYEAGDIRIQAADAPLDAVVAGPDGVELILMLADRRALPAVEAADAAWRSALDAFVADLSPMLVTH